MKVYKGAIDPEHVEYDYQHIPQTDAERLARALPFPSNRYRLEFGRNYLSMVLCFFSADILTKPKRRSSKRSATIREVRRRSTE